MINNYFDCEYRPYHHVHTHQSGSKLFLGDIAAALDLNFIQNENISIVITAALGMDHVAYQPSIQHVVYPLVDKKGESINKHFRAFYQLTEKELKNKNMLVHCFAGVSRSATLVISYLMKKYKWSFKEAISYVRQSRSNVLPNLGFQRQLKLYEKQLQNEEQVQARKIISKTSQSRKHHSKENKNKSGLPEIVAFGKTIFKGRVSNLVFPSGSQMQSRRIKLGQFYESGNEQKKKSKIQINEQTLKSYHKKTTNQSKKMETLFGKKENQQTVRRGLAFNEIKFTTQKLIKPKLRLFGPF